MRAKRTIVGMLLALTAAALAPACDAEGGGPRCFGAEYGPPEPSCAKYDLGLSCPIGSEPTYTCVCAADGEGQRWVCAPGAGTTGSGGGAGVGGGGGGGGGAGGGSGAGGGDGGA